MVIRLLKNVLVLCCIKQALLTSLFQSWLLMEVVEAAAASENDLASEPRSVPELIEYWDYPGETHWIKTADNYILAVHRITGPAASIASEAATEASTSVRPIAFLQHGLFGTSARWTLGPPDKVGKPCCCLLWPLRLGKLFVFFIPVFSLHSGR